MNTRNNRAGRRHKRLRSRNAVETAIAASKGGRSTTWEAAAKARKASAPSKPAGHSELEDESGEPFD